MVPRGAKFVCATIDPTRGESILVTALVDSSEPQVPANLVLLHSNWTREPNFEYIDTVVIGDGIWHVFEVLPVPPHSAVILQNNIMHLSNITVKGE